MKTLNTSKGIDHMSSQTKSGNKKLIRAIQFLSHAVTVIFIIFLLWAIYQAIVYNNPLPAWAWMGVLVLFAVSVGLVVAFIVYRGVARQVGPFDFRPSYQVTGELRNESQSVNAGEATSLRAEIRITAGILQLLGGAQGAMEGNFIYDDADWKPPLVDYAIGAGGQGTLAVEQQSTGRPAMRQGRCEWLLRLNRTLPTELMVKFGAGKADLHLGGLALDRLRVESGVGELDLDLTGAWDRRLTASIKSGIGDITLRLPEDVGVRIHSTVGLGSIHTHDLTWDGEFYTNKLYGRGKVDLDIAVEGGVGKINLRQESKMESRQ